MWAHQTTKKLTSAGPSVRPVLERWRLFRLVFDLRPVKSFLKVSRGMYLMLFQLSSVRDGSFSMTIFAVFSGSVTLSGSMGGSFFGTVAFTTDSNLSEGS